MANQKIDSIKLSGSTEIYDLDLPKTATPSIAGLTTGYLTVTGSTIISGNPLFLSSNTLELTASNKVLFSLPPSASTMTTRNIITLETSDFIDNTSPCISLANRGGSVSVNGKIGITLSNGIGFLKTYDGSIGNNTYLTVNDSCVNMGIIDVTSNDLFDNFATFSENRFNITLSQNLLDDGADPFMRITGTLSNFTLEFPTAQTDITIDPNIIYLNRITPKITTSQGHLIAYPGCGYTSTDSYTILSKSDLKSWTVGSQGVAALTSSTLAVSSYTLSGGDIGCVYHIFGFEQGNTGQNPGELRVSKSKTSHTDRETIIVASNDVGYHGNSYIGLTVIVPAGETYYLWGKNIGDIRSFKVYL